MAFYGHSNVSQILVTPLSRLHVKGGDVLHAIKRTDPGYIDFGEAYFSIIESNAIKAWKRHLRMTLNLYCAYWLSPFCFLRRSR